MDPTLNIGYRQGENIGYRQKSGPTKYQLPGIGFGQISVISYRPNLTESPSLVCTEHKVMLRKCLAYLNLSTWERRFEGKTLLSCLC